MTNEITKQLMAVCMRNGVVVWVEKERITSFMDSLSGDKHKFVEIDGQYVNTADVVGVFEANTMEELTRRKNGEWNCKGGEWHARNERCECISTEHASLLMEAENIIKDCKKCDSRGLIEKGNTVTICGCSKEIRKKIKALNK